MTSRTVTIAKDRGNVEYSFFEALNADFDTLEAPQLISKQQLGLPPSPTTSTPQPSVTASQEPKQKSLPPRPTEENLTRTTTNVTPKMENSSRTQQRCLELCHKTTIPIDKLSIRILEYLTTTKEPVHGFETLAYDFLDTCQILFSIEAGLTDCVNNSQKLPVQMLSELDSKFRVTQADFQILEQMLGKLLGTSGGMKRRWGKLFGDTDIKKMRMALAKTRESLRISSLMFQWSLGDDVVEKEMGIGYTGLCAALDKMDKKNGTGLPRVGNGNVPHATKSQPQVVSTAVQESEHTQPKPQVPLQPFQHEILPLEISTTDSHSSFREQSQSHKQPENPHLSLFPSPPLLIETHNPYYKQHQQPQHQHQHHSQQAHPSSPSLQWSNRSPSTRVNGSVGRAVGEETFNAVELRKPLSLNLRQSASTGHDSYDRASIVEDSRSMTGITEPDGFIDIDENMVSEYGPVEVVKHHVDLSTLPRYYPQSTASSEADSANMRSALIQAIRSRNHNSVEQLLNRGAAAQPLTGLHALKEAINIHDGESVRLLLLFGVDPNDSDRDGVTPLLTALEKSFLKGATVLLKHGADPNLVTGQDLESPLAIAVAANLIGFTQLLLSYNGDANHITSNGNTLLISAIQKKTPKRFLDMLLDYGSNPNAKGREGKTALFEAIQLGRADLVASLLDHGADANLPGPKHMLWPSTFHPQCLQLLLSAGADHKKCPGIMELAVSANNTETVRILLKAGVNPNIKKDGTYTPLCTSIRDDRPELLRLLLSNGADPNVMASEYPAFKCITHNRLHFLPILLAAGADLNSPKGIIETAVSHNNMQALTWLLDQGVNPNDKNPKKQSPLTTAIREANYEMVDVLLQRGADPHMRGEDWPICMAVRNPPILKRILEVVSEPQAFKGVVEMAVHADKLESVKLLLAANVSVEDKNGGVFSPLTTALRENRREIVRYLLTTAKADVNAPGEHLPIVKALRRYHEEDTEMLKLLLAHGADPNKIYRGWNAFMQAVENGDIDVLRLLTESVGCDLEVKDDMGRTVLELAASRGWDEAVEALREGQLKKHD